ncbi:MAG TPA: hypothetical protein P5137_01020 [Candidatus Brocadiia bacterium]|nr:hypothetical protein [Candidatus Brocadiia bacterium]
MPAAEAILQISNRAYRVSKLSTRGYFAVAAALAGRPGLRAALCAATNDRQAAAALLTSGLVEVALRHAVSPAPDLDALAPEDARRLLQAALDVNPLPEIFEELDRFFVLLAPAAGQARAAAQGTDGNSSSTSSPATTGGPSRPS